MCDRGGKSRKVAVRLEVSQHVLDDYKKKSENTKQTPKELMEFAIVERMALHDSVNRAEKLADSQIAYVTRLESRLRGCCQLITRWLNAVSVGAPPVPVSEILSLLEECGYKYDPKAKT